MTDQEMLIVKLQSELEQSLINLSSAREYTRQLEHTVAVMDVDLKAMRALVGKQARGTGGFGSTDKEGRKP